MPLLLQLRPLEIAVLELQLEGDHPALVALRRQLPGLRVSARDHTGVGFFTQLAPAADAPLAPWIPDLTISDGEAEIAGLAHGAGFVLFVTSGRLVTLEGFTYDEDWPAEVGAFSVRHSPWRERLLAALPLPPP